MITLVKDPLWNKCVSILDSLANRKGHPHWLHTSHFNQNGYNSKCILCDKTFTRETSVVKIKNEEAQKIISEIREHGMLHLKESNLLPFI
jgi:hypothetical protein